MVLRPLKLVLFASSVLLGTSLRSVGAAKDPQQDEIEKLAENGPLLVDNYIPVAMQVLHHCVEMIQYEPLMSAPSTTTSLPTSTTTTSSTTLSTTESSVTVAPLGDTQTIPTSSHKPGYYGPEKPPPTPVTTTTMRTTTSTASTTVTQPATSVEEVTGSTTEQTTTVSLLWSDKPFAEWFLQAKRKKTQNNPLKNVEFLDVLPLKLLQDINAETYEPLALRPSDNANEFRRVYDDSYGRGSTNLPEKSNRKGGKKRVPPTKPYLHMLVLYDLLKREAKNNLFNYYEGYSEAIMAEITQMDFPTAKDQLQYVLSQLLERKDIEKSDVVSRTKLMIRDLDISSSSIAMALVVVPPLRFGL
ncbi:uncharacterized protein LOC126569420 [Anopheles aquasalis]|uniref:uncharacterized protein LOC126569420 n=1 Tax=Anopheles aquasalis TaxID=42839 RepID=UPI00215B248D|nr:uncharacterized protein LOC126569420 [Anopheles aquasalis]